MFPLFRRGTAAAPALSGRSPLVLAWLVLAGLVLASCSTPADPVRPVQTLPPMTGPIANLADSPAALVGWASEDHVSAFDAWLAGCGVARSPGSTLQCHRAREIQRVSRPVTPDQARIFFETGFRVVQAQTADGSPGLLTAYFAPEYEARHQANAEFDAPVLARPSDLQRSASGAVQRRADGTSIPYPDRAAIESSSSGRVLAWMRAEDLFFLQIQGSGYVTFPQGTPGQPRTARLAYAADNGHPFIGIARPMVERGLLPVNGTSGDAIKAWLSAHRGAQARAVMALNPRYIFFRMDADDGGHPAGAAGIALPPRRSIAVDPASWTYGDLVWIDADAGNLPGARHSYRGLVMALDTGSAIRGPVRADFYMGRGEAAGSEAGSVRHPLRMWRLVPKE